MAEGADPMVMRETGVIEATHLSKAFSDTEGENLEALSDYNLRIQPGEFVSLLGPSGCGKSTFLRILAGLESATGGTVRLDGEVVNGTDYRRGLVFQQPKLFPWMNLYENVAFGLRSRGIYRENKHKVMEYLDMVGLADFSRSYPYQLSGGMAQRAALARALINSPEVLCLDEPLGALDTFTRLNMQDELLNLWQRSGHMMLMVTHDIDEALYLGTRVVVMAPRPGRIRVDMKNDIPYPRNRTSSAFLKFRKDVLEMLDFGHAEGA